MLRVAITRSLPNAELTAEAIRKRGAEPVITPLLNIVPVFFDTDVTGVQALLFSSANGVSIFATRSPYRDRVVFTVGEKTAAWAKAAGFTDVRSADGDSAALADLTIATLKPSDGRVLHISGDHVAGDVLGTLKRAGFNAERRTAYVSMAVSSVEDMPEELNGPLDVVLFHSTRAAETFVALGAPNAKKLIAGCMSEMIAEAAAETSWKRIVTAPHPREDDLLAATLGG